MEHDVTCRRDSPLLSRVGDRRVYFVHSYRATPSPENNDWVLATTEYGGSFISAVHKGEICATQFHPEKSGSAGLDIIESFLEAPEEPRPAYTNGDDLQKWVLVVSKSVSTQACLSQRQRFLRSDPSQVLLKIS